MDLVDSEEIQIAPDLFFSGSDEEDCEQSTTSSDSFGKRFFCKICEIEFVKCVRFAKHMNIEHESKIS